LTSPTDLSLSLSLSLSHSLSLSFCFVLGKIGLANDEVFFAAGFIDVRSTTKTTASDEKRIDIMACGNGVGYKNEEHGLNGTLVHATRNAISFVVGGFKFVPFRCGS